MGLTMKQRMQTCHPCTQLSLLCSSGLLSNAPLSMLCPVTGKFGLRLNRHHANFLLFTYSINQVDKESLLIKYQLFQQCAGSCG